MSLTSDTQGTASSRPLSALLSQVLVAFTVEFDNEFERQMIEAGYPGARLSLVVWANLLRFVGEGGISVRELAAQALASVDRMKFRLGCLERWEFVILQPPGQTVSGRERRAGWGSGRGIRLDWVVWPTSQALAASEIWPPLFGEIETGEIEPGEIELRWKARFGKDVIGRLRGALQAVADKLEFELPHGLPGSWEDTATFPPRVQRGTASLPLPTLLSQSLLTFRIEFDRDSPAPLIHCANTLRVLGERPIRLADLPRLTGISPETSDIGWEIRPYVVVTPDPVARRGKVVRLSPRGLLAQQAYHRLIEEIEKRWQERFGAEAIGMLCESLEALFDAPLFAEGLVPPPGTLRAGVQSPALGRRGVGVAARQRMRDLVAQTEAFVRDPAGSLPHYPAWDMNRGFGP
jgi:hypothetical protein